MEFKIIGTDDRVYGPIDLATLREWVTEQRIDGQTWVYENSSDRWSRASQLAAITELFQSQDTRAASRPMTGSHPSLLPGHLRRLKVLADLTDEQLSLFVNLVEKVQVSAQRPVVKMNEPGDCMYLILSGELFVYQVNDGRETLLAKLETGDFFGEVCLFDEGPRSANVIAAMDCTLLKITKRAFHEILTKHPEVAAPFLFALTRTVEARIRSTNKRYTDTMTLARAWSGAPPTPKKQPTTAAARPPPRS